MVKRCRFLAIAVVAAFVVVVAAGCQLSAKGQVKHQMKVDVQEAGQVLRPLHVAVDPIYRVRHSAEHAGLLFLQHPGVLAAAALG